MSRLEEMKQREKEHKARSLKFIVCSSPLYVLRTCMSIVGVVHLGSCFSALDANYALCIGGVVVFFFRLLAQPG